MRTRAKALTVAAAMVLTFAVLPTFGAAAAEPLEDGSYDVVIAETTYTVDVVEGAPAIEGAEGVEFTFAFDEETNRVLDEFDVTVDGVTYDVAVADDGTVTVTAADGEDEQSEGEESEGDGEEADGEGEREAEGEGEDLADEDDEDDEDEDDEELQALEEGDDIESLEEGDEVDDGGHGALVSTVAQCAPRGKQARAAGLPNHGFFVRAAAKGEAVEFEADGEAHSADLSSQEGADAFCAVADELLAAAAEGEPGTAADDGGQAGSRAGGEANGNGRGNGNGRADAPGQLKKNG